MNLIDYLVMKKQWHPTSETTRAAHGCCPYHTDNTPSFKIDFTEVPWHFHCYGAGCPFDGTGLYGVVKWLEFDGRNDDASRRLIAARVRELGGDSQVPDTWSHTHVQKRERGELDLRRLPTDEEQLCMTVAHQWWVQQLFSNSAKEIRAYVRERGINLAFAEATGRIGYAPYCYEDTQPFRELSKRLADVCGEDWKRIAKSIGVFTRDTTHMRMHHRLIFSQIDEDTGLVQMFLGRAMKESQKTYKWLLPYDIRVVPFYISVKNPVIPGTTISEAPFEAFVMAQPVPGYTGINHRAQIGNRTIPMSYLLQLPRPIFVAFNNDESEAKGEKMAQDLIRRLNKEGIENYRVKVPTTADKDIDNFVLRQGGNTWQWVAQYPREIAVAI